MSIEPFASSASAITPIVFCASFAPCVNATNVPENSCPIRNIRFAGEDGIRWKTQKIAISRTNAAANAIVGAMNAGMTTLWARVCHWTPSSPGLRRWRRRRGRRSARATSSTAARATT